MTPSQSSGSREARILAVLALLATAGLVVCVIAFLIANIGYVVLGLLGLGVAVWGGWSYLTGRRQRRGFGVVGLVAGFGVMAGALIGAGITGEQVFLRLVVVLCLLALTLGAGRGAMVRSVRADTEGYFERSTPPSHPVLICNPWSGGGKVEKFGLSELARSMGVETVMLEDGLDLEQLARDAIARGADCLGMAGGDGSQALVATIAIEHDIPFVCVSAGTRNHFALDLGLDREDPRRSLDAFRDAVERRVDYATVNGRLFVNNVSLGVYATIVQQEGYRQAKLDTSTSVLPDLLGRTDQPFDLQFTEAHGQEVDGAFVIQVSNNPYVLEPSADLSQRRRLDTGRLGVFAVTAASGVQAAEVVTTMLTRHHRSRHIHEFTTTDFEVRSRSGSAFAGIDGEALELPTPLDFRIHPRALRLLVPRGNIEQAVRRRARDVRFRDLAAVVSGS